MTVVIGEPDPLSMPETAKIREVCAAVSERPLFVPAGFICTRAPGHTATDEQHVASGDVGSGLVAIATWTDAAPTPRVMDDDTFERIRAAGRRPS